MVVITEKLVPELRHSKSSSRNGVQTGTVIGTAAAVRHYSQVISVAKESSEFVSSLRSASQGATFVAKGTSKISKVVSSLPIVEALVVTGNILVDPKNAANHIKEGVLSFGGAQGGAFLGTLICPGIGTAVGSVLGGLLGSWIGSK